MTAFNVILIIGFVFTGASNGLNSKWQFQTCAPSRPTNNLVEESAKDKCAIGHRHFNKPWMQNWMMFWGEFALLPMYILTRQLRMGGGKRITTASSSEKPSIVTFLLPASCDLVGTGLQNVGLMFVSAPVAQMMKSSTVVFSAFLTVTILKKKLHLHHYLAVAATTVGLLLVSFATLQDTQNDPSGSFSQTVMGLSLVLLGVLSNAFQWVLEEYLLSGYKLSAQWVVGLEGMWGVLLQGALLIVFTYLPGSDNGVVEDFTDTLEMFSGEGSQRLHCLAVFFMLCVSVGQLCGMTITKKLSAVTRCLLCNCCSILVWVTTLCLYYGGLAQYGSPWTANSWFQLAGFLLAILGTLLYNEVLKIPFLDYRQDDEAKLATVVWSRQVSDNADLYAWSPSSPRGHDTLHIPSTLQQSLLAKTDAECPSVTAAWIMIDA